MSSAIRTSITTFTLPTLCVLLVLAAQGCRTCAYRGPLPVPTPTSTPATAAVSRSALPSAPAGMSWDFRDVWRKATLVGDGKWHGFTVVDTSGYLDTTDDGAGEITASGEGVNEKEHYSKAFDNSEAKWCIKTPTIWIQYRYPEGVRKSVTAYTITSGNDFQGRDPKNWRLLGSNDGKEWTAADERTDVTFAMRHQKKLFVVKTPGAYAMYKLDVTENRGNDDTSQLTEIELLVPKPAVP